MKYTKRIKEAVKEKNLLKLLIVLIFFSILSSGVSLFFSQRSNAMKETISSSKIYPGLNLKTRKQEADIYTLFISQPVSDIEKINDPINQWVNQERENFKKEVQSYETSLKENDFSAHLNIQTDTDKLADNLYNLELESYQLTGGANGTTKTKTFLLDLKAEKFLETKDIFSIEEESLTAIRELFYEELEKEKIDFVFENLVEERMADDDSWRVSIHSDSVSFIFDQYEIAAGAAGDIHVSIPMEKIKAHLNPSFAKRISLEVPEEEVVEEEIVEEERIEKEEKKEPLKADDKYIALTFDDGPHLKVTPRILDILKDHEIKATFYMLGNQVDYYPGIAKDVYDQGHELASHTMSHKDLTLLGAGQIREEIQRTTDSIKKATGAYPKSIRPPYGAYNDAVKNLASEFDLPMVMWSVDSLDWKNRETQAINQEVMSTVHSGAILLLHDIHATTADALPVLLKNLENEGYEFLTVSQLLEYADLDGVGPYYNVKMNE